MKKIIVLFLVFTSLLLQAQPGKRGPKGSQPKLAITGKVIDETSGDPIGYATVAVFNIESEEMLNGSTTEDDGAFELNVTKQNVYVEISFLGYTTQRIDKLVFNRGTAILGKIFLKEDAKTLDEVVITADKSSTEFKLDKRVFNVGTDLSSTGASALEVLNNVPSVNVNIEGGVTLRGSGGVQILINGKPSVLANDESSALGTITADMIEKVEVITNPSAKYEAEGTAGIINIVLKKDEKKGLNGSITLNTGIPQNHSVGLSINNRTEKFNLFTQLGVGYREVGTIIENLNRNLSTGLTVASEGEEFRNEIFYNLILGTDYYINKNNVITLSGSFAYEVEQQPSETNFDLTDETGNLQQQWRREEVTEATNPKLQYELQYKRDFKDHKDHQLLFSAIGNYFGKDQSSVFSEAIELGNRSLTNQLTATEFEEGKYTFNLDYTKPFAKFWTIETGAQFVTNNVSNDYEVQDLIGNEYLTDPALTNEFNYDQKVLGIYGTGSYEGDIWGLKLGLRLENTELKTLLVNTNQSNDRNFNNLFPSVHTSYKLSDKVSLQAGYSRRIYRPRLWDLNPFFNIRNNFTIRTGNPDLLPEFTDSYEIGSIFIYDKVSFNFNVYHRFTTDIIERVSVFSENVNVFKPVNIGTKNTTGLEANFKYSPLKKITINGDANFNFFARAGDFDGQNFDFSASQWSAKLNNKFKVNRSFDFEITGRFQSEERTFQGLRSEIVFADFGLRYKIMKGKGVLNMSIRDIFASRNRETITEGADFYAYAFRQRGTFYTIGFSYGFGKGEAMQYRGGGRRR